MNTSPKAVNSGQTEREALTDEHIEKGWRDTFSTNNPFCPCNLKSFTKAVRWAERAITATLQPNDFCCTGCAKPTNCRESGKCEAKARALLAEQSAAPMAEQGYCQARANNEDCNCASACARWVPAPPPRASDEAVTDAARDVLAERRRQVTAEGWTPEHDDEYERGELAMAAAAYAHAAGEAGYGVFSVPREWPLTWVTDWWKPTTPRRNLVKAGALILAEIERLDRAARAKEPK